MPATVDGVELNADTDPLRPSNRNRRLRRRCDGCAWPLPADPTDNNVWRVGRPDGSAVHLYLCGTCDDEWART